MLHDIEGFYNNHYAEQPPRPSDRVLSFSETTLLISENDGTVGVPTVVQAGIAAEQLQYLFSIDDYRYFLARTPVPGAGDAERSLQGRNGIDAGQIAASQQAAIDGFSYRPLRDFRWIRPRNLRFAIEVAWQLSHWYADNRYCGRCGTPTEHDRVERMLSCPKCGNMIYPKISPGIIVGIVNDDKLLLTRYAGGGYRAWALVAGFTEIGEPLEDTVRREVHEETGLKVKNITYFGNQPWPRSASLLVGFFAELDGSPKVTLQREELAESAWMPWTDVPHEPDDYSLTNTMMCAFYREHDHLDRLISR
jgi:NAD+ diphosphatase